MIFFLTERNSGAFLAPPVNHSNRSGPQELTGGRCFFTGCRRMRRTVPCPAGGEFRGETTINHQPSMTSITAQTKRREFIKIMGAAGAGLFFPWRGGVLNVAAQVPVGTLDPTTIPKFQTPMLIPPVMPVASILALASGQKVDSYKISMRQFSQQVLPAGMPKTTVWGYGPVEVGSARAPRIYNAPSMTIEAQWNRPVRVKWVNELLDARGRYLPHLFAVDPTIHWANPGGGVAGRDSRPAFQATPGRYTGPVPLVTHLHGAVGVGDESDGYSEAWYLPDATNLPDGYAKSGTWYGFFAKKALAKRGVVWEAGAASYQYPNLNRASTLWYHDHTLGLTRLNVYAGGAGFYIVRG